MPDPISSVSREDLQELNDYFREIKHDINNTFAVVMALAELAQRNPAHYEKLTKELLRRGPEVVQAIQEFHSKLTAKLKESEAAQTAAAA
ncbi:MAG: hypothetical protein ABMA13_22290 [Chthoniobacteraceae bacterium]